MIPNEKYLGESDFEGKLLSFLRNVPVMNLVRALRESPLTSLSKFERELFIKHEVETQSKTFKYRGAHVLMNYLKQVSLSGILATSTGNHGVSLALIGRELKIKVTVCMPFETAREKITLIESLGGEVKLMGKNLTETIVIGKEYAQTAGFFYISSLHEALIFGHSTLISEALTQNGDIRTMYFPIGVGAGISGQIIGKMMNKLSIKIIGVVHESHPTWAISADAGKVTQAKCESSLAPGIRISKPDDGVFSFVNKYVDDIIVIGDKDLLRTAESLKLPSSSDLTSLVSIAGSLKIGVSKEIALAVRC